MARRQWTEIPGNEASYYLLHGRVDSSFGGATSTLDQFDSGRMRLAVNLLARCCAKLKLQGSYALQGARHGNEVGVALATDSIADFMKLGLLTGSKRSGGSPPWRGLNEFVLDEALHERLLGTAGKPDGRGPERYARARQASLEEDRSLRWRVIDHRGG